MSVPSAIMHMQITHVHATDSAYGQRIRRGGIKRGSKGSGCETHGPACRCCGRRPARGPVPHHKSCTAMTSGICRYLVSTFKVCTQNCGCKPRPSDEGSPQKRLLRPSYLKVRREARKIVLSLQISDGAAGVKKVHLALSWLALRSTFLLLKLEWITCSVSASRAP